MADHREDPLKIVKLNGTNYHEWKDDMKSLLILKDWWETMQEDAPPPSSEEELRNEWRRIQRQSRSLIHLCCERDQSRLIADAVTGIEACICG